MIRRDRPKVLVVSPPCTLFSNLQTMSGGPDPAKYREAVRLFEVVVDLCCYQRRHGGDYLLEHPKTSKAWSLECVDRLWQLEDTVAVTFHTCAFGMEAEDLWGRGRVLKPTMVMTSSPSIAQCLDVQCAGGHRHVHLVNGRAKKAAEYPPGMSDAILKGLAIRERRRLEVNAVEAGIETNGMWDMCDPEDYPE